MKKHILATLAIAICATAVFAADSLDVMLTKIFGQSKPPTAPPYALTSYALVDKDNNVIAKSWNGSLDLSSGAKGAMNTYFDGGWKWDSTEELALGVDLVDSPGAVRSVLTLTKANTGTHDFVALVEDTGFFIHRESGNDFLVTITDQSTKSAIALVNHK